MHDDQNTMMNANILIVDDHIENLQLLTGILELNEYYVQAVSDGYIAIMSAKTDPPDLIILDILMPEPDGYEICRQLKEDKQTRDIPIIFISALDDPLDKLKAFSLGGVDYITKPFKAREVLLRVKAHLTLHAMRQRLQQQNEQLAQEVAIRKRTEEDLRVLARAVEQSANAIMITDSEGTIKFVNPAFSTITGYTLEEAIGKSANIMQSGNHSLQFYQEMWEILRRGDVWQGEWLNKRKNGELYWESATISPVKNQAEQITHYVAVKEDISERKQAEEQLKHLNHQLKEANTSKDIFFSILAHDLRSPFTLLLGNSEVAARQFDELSKEELKECITEIHTTAESVYTLLENLLSWSQLQQGVLEYHPSSLCLYELVDYAVQLFLSHAEQKKITLSNHVPETVVVYADTHMISTVIRNLISNALKFTDSGGMIDISTRQNIHKVEVTIKDTGMGISSEDLPHLFRIDKKLSRIGTAGEKGTGLGLSLCKYLIEKNGGSVWVQSDLGEGTTFRFTLPYQPC